MLERVRPRGRGLSEAVMIIPILIVVGWGHLDFLVRAVPSAVLIEIGKCRCSVSGFSWCSALLNSY